MASIIPSIVPLAITCVWYVFFAVWILFGTESILNNYGVDIKLWTKMELILNIGCMIGSCIQVLLVASALRNAMWVGKTTVQSPGCAHK